MSAGPTHFVARHVHDLVERQRLDSLADDELLGRFVSTRDEEAFAALVRRHGPMVLGTCRRVLHQSEDAEDACQATFLILARKGRSVRGRNCLAGWLHRVALRVALRLRRDRARRTTEPLPSELHSRDRTDSAAMSREIVDVFDAEVGRLPRRLRLPLLLCYLQGLTRNEAAKRLGWSEGALRGRLERGRKLLQMRFRRKGLVLPAALTATLLEHGIPSASSAAIIPSAAASRLADVVLRSMTAAQVKMAAWSVAFALLIGTIAGLGAFHTATAQPTKEPTPSPTPSVSVADAQANLDTFVLRIWLAPKGEGKFDPKFSLHQVLLYVPNLRFEPPANGPDGKPTEAYARISKEEARKIVDTLGRFDFFRDDVIGDPFPTKLSIIHARNWPHAGIAVRFQKGDDATSTERLLAWLPQMLPPLDAIRACVKGDAAKAMDQLLAPLADDRKRWDSTVDADYRKLQGNWATDPDGKKALPKDLPVNGEIAKCTIDGRTIVFKPRVQRDPLLDLETIRGTFELSGDKYPRRMTIKGVRDTIAKTETGVWTALYEFEDDTLFVLLPSMNTAPSKLTTLHGLSAGSAENKRPGQRRFTLQRIAGEKTSDWGPRSKGVQTRLRAAKTRFAAAEIPTFELDVRDTSANSEKGYWQGLRMGELARVEIDGVWYHAPESSRTSAVLDKLLHGQTIKGWTTIQLPNDYWIVEGFDQKLTLKPGKHAIRVQFPFSSAGSRAPDCLPVSGQLEIQIARP